MGRFSGRQLWFMRFDPDGTEIGHFNGGGMDSPWDTAVDGEDNVWVANFGPLESGPSFHRQAHKALGSQCLLRERTLAIQYHRRNGYTVPSAGSEVLLHNGDPLYGPGAPPSFIPMMRQTSCGDRSGWQHLVR